MIEKIKVWLALQKKKQEVSKNLAKSKKYFTALKQGEAFIKFMRQDMEAMKAQKMNREQRRRFEHGLHHKGEFCPEMIEYYAKKLDQILAYLDAQEKALKENKAYKNKPGAIKTPQSETGETKSNV
jgi:hypothetical protein